MAKKSNEKTAIPDLIAHLDISGALVSIDAMGTHIAFAQQILAILRKMVLQLLLKNKGKDSLKKVGKRAAWNDDFLVEVLKTIPN